MIISKPPKSMTSIPARSGMPVRFGIRITEADKDKLVGELDIDDRHLDNSDHVHGGALAAFADDLGGTHWPGSTPCLGFRQPRRVEDEYFSRPLTRAQVRFTYLGLRMPARR